MNKSGATVSKWYEKEKREWDRQPVQFQFSTIDTDTIWTNCFQPACGIHSPLNLYHNFAVCASFFSVLRLLMEDFQAAALSR
jgi:hypothetical protein